LSDCWYFKSWIFGALLFLVSSSCAEAYTDEIEANFDEVWKAGEQILQPYGIRNSKVDKKEMESKWIEDLVVRSRRLLPVGFKGKIHQTYQRRYRVRIQIKEGVPHQTVQLTVKGFFQIKPSDALPQRPWESVGKPQMVDYEIERNFFFKILHQIEHNRYAP